MRQERVQIRDLQGDPRLRPAPVQGDTYAPPPRQGPDNRLGDLANALQGFSGALGNLLAQAKKSDPKRDQEDAWKAQRQFAGRTSQEWADAVRKGEVPEYANPVQQTAINKLAGDGFGKTRADEVRQYLMTEFDWDNADPEEYISQIIAQDLETYGANHVIGKAYMSQMDSLRGWAAQYREQRTTQEFHQAKKDAAFVVFDQKVDDLITSGASPEDVVKAVHSWYPTLGKNGTLGVDYKELDRELLNKARRLSQTNPEVALALVNSERKGTDGQVISLATSREHRDAVLQIQATAQRAIKENAEKSARAQYDAQADQLFEEGYGSMLVDQEITTATGDRVLLRGEKAREEARMRYLERSRIKASEYREAPEQQLFRELTVLSRNGQTHPQVEGALSGISQLASPGVMDDPQSREQLMQKLQYYDTIARQNQQWAIAHTSKEDRYFAEGYRVARDVLQKDPEAAVQFAINSSQFLTKEGWESVNRYRDEIDTAVEGLGTKPGFLGLWNSDVTPQNWSVMRQEVTNLAQRFVHTGVKPDKAVELAAEVIKRSHVTYKGVLLNLSGQSIPEDFTGTVDGFLDRFFTKNPDVLTHNSIDKKDVALRPLIPHGPSDGRFVLVDRETMLPLTDASGRQMRVSLDHFNKMDAQDRQEREQKLDADRIQSSSRRQQGLSQGVGIEGGVSTFDPKTREVYEWDPKASRYKKTGRRMKVRPNDDPLYQDNQ